MNLFLNAALIVVATMTAVTIWMATAPEDAIDACPGWWIFPSLVLSVLIIAGVLL